MPEELKTAETTQGAMEAYGAVGGHADTDQGADVNDADFTDSGAGRGSEEPHAAEKSKREQNAANARRRREAERRAAIKRAEETAREQAIIETLDGKNPYTGEDMTDAADVKEYLAMREIEKQGGDPLADFSKFQKRQAREAEEKATREREQQAWYREDSEAFAAAHPEVSLASLIADKGFQQYAHGKVGEMPLSEIYEGYTQIVGEFEKKAKSMAAQMLANNRATPGALSGANPPSGLFTREQVQKMSRAEVREHYDSIRESMRHWK